MLWAMKMQEWPESRALRTNFNTPFKEATQGRTTVLGVVDPSEVIARGTPEAVAEAVREELEVLAPGGGLIIGPGCALPPETPAENMHAFVEAAQRHGRYAPDGSLAS